MTAPCRKKLIEVALPLKAINEASAREIGPAWAPEHLAPLLVCPSGKPRLSDGPRARDDFRGTLLERTQGPRKRGPGTQRSAGERGARAAVKRWSHVRGRKTVLRRRLSVPRILLDELGIVLVVRFVISYRDGPPSDRSIRVIFFQILMTGGPQKSPHHCR